ncbi:MAG: 4-alpha-glucanotransferase [Gammaproteobacteria bacterium]|nr:4-alpha-glucanotransferase [Gammaproteobacteria bacterium]
MPDNDPVLQLASRCGIQPHFYDVWDKRREVSATTLQALLASMGIAVKECHHRDAAIAELEARAWRRPLSAVQVVHAHEMSPRIALNLPATYTTALNWRLTEEHGRIHEGTIDPRTLEALSRHTLNGIEYQRRAFPLPFMPEPGYHLFALAPADADQDQLANMTLIVAPSRCHAAPALQNGGRAWGISTQLYAIRSQRNWGIGDFTDLTALIDHAARLGADALGLNPLHVLFPHNPAHRSPYSPSSRLFFNSLYLDIDKIIELDGNDSLRQSVSEADFQQRLLALRERERVDYPGVAAVKFPTLEALFANFQKEALVTDSERAAAFREFKQQGGEPLYYHALFEALQAHFSAQQPPLLGWSAWPPEYRDPASPAVEAFASAHADRIEFYLYLQWQVASQLAAAVERAREAGLRLGLYLDLAVGVDQEGAEAWAHQRVYATGASVGAPPDLYNLKGQNWGLPPLIPIALTDTGYALFIATLRNNMRYAHALRIDHVMGLMRLYWVPAGATAADGAFVHYPLNDLLGILALESQRNQCFIIGEDLGTVPDEVREGLTPRGVLSYRVMYFEKQDDGRFKPPVEYPAQALAAISTHDLPTLAGFWEDVDLQVRAELDLFPTDELRQQQEQERAEDRAQLLSALRQEKILKNTTTLNSGQSPRMTDELATAIHRFVARTPSQLMLVQIEDALGQREAVNLPATTDEHPNWQRKLSVPLEDFDEHPLLRNIAAAVNAERGRPSEKSRS